MRRLDNEDQVKDAVQDLFIKLWSNRKNIKLTSNIRYYLLASLKNQLVNVQVAQNRKRTVSLEEAAPFRLDFSADSAYLHHEQNGQQARLLLDAMNQLTPRQKEIIYLRYFEELSYEQIAELMDTSLKGIYKLNYRALDALKEILHISRKDLLLLLLLCRMHA